MVSGREISSELNWVFHIDEAPPAIRTQADGLYPGIDYRTPGTG